MTSYLIKLKPVENFFFGGEVTFGDKQDQQNLNYLVRSNPFPQQTALLGTLRKEILIQNGCLMSTAAGYALDTSRIKEVAELIGPESFDMSKPDQNFGRIQKISPLFLIRDKEAGTHDFFIAGPMDRGLKFAPEKGLSRCGDPNRLNIPRMQEYKAKEPFNEGFIAAAQNADKSEFIKFSDIFITDERIGIKKGDRGKTDEDGFFKQFAYILKKGFSFACIAELECLLSNTFVFLGADRSTFKMTLETFSASFDDLFGVAADPERMVLLSDAHVAKEVYARCRFAVTQTLSFRNIKSNTNNYRFRKEEKLHFFLKRGSVLYPESGKRGELETLIHNAHLQKIGYNIFK